MLCLMLSKFSMLQQLSKTKANHNEMSIVVLLAGRTLVFELLKNNCDLIISNVEILTIVPIDLDLASIHCQCPLDQQMCLERAF